MPPGSADEPDCKPDSVPGIAAEGRPSIWDHRCRWPRAAYPRARAGRPRTLAQGPVGPLLALLRVGFAEPCRSPGTLVVSYTAVSPLPMSPSAVCFLWHCPAGRPGWLLAITLPCGVRTFLDGNSRRDRPSNSSAARLRHHRRAAHGMTMSSTQPPPRVGSRSTRNPAARQASRSSCAVRGARLTSMSARTRCPFAALLW